MRLVTPVLLDAFPLRVVNIHPALLPSFPGVHGPAAGARVRRPRRRAARCTSSTRGTDTGPIIAQAAVPVLEDDDEETLRLRILRASTSCSRACSSWIAEGRVHVEQVAGGGRARVRDRLSPGRHGEALRRGSPRRRHRRPLGGGAARAAFVARARPRAGLAAADLPVRRSDARAAALHVPRGVVAGLGPRAGRARAVADLPPSRRRPRSDVPGPRARAAARGSARRRALRRARSTAPTPRSGASSTSSTPSSPAPTAPPTPPSRRTSCGRRAASGSAARPSASPRRCRASTAPALRPLLAEFPRDHDYRAIVDVPARFASHAAELPEFAVARLHGAWTRGVSRLARRRGRARRVPPRAPAGPRRRGSPRRASAARIEHRRGRVSGVVVDGDEAATGVEFVVTDHSTRALLDLTPTSILRGARSPRSRTWFPPSGGSSYRSSCATRALPEPLADEAFLLPEWPHRGMSARRRSSTCSDVASLAGSRARRCSSPRRPSPRGPRCPSTRAREAVLARHRGPAALHRAALPASSTHPHDGRPLWDYRSGTRKDVDRAALRAGAARWTPSRWPLDGASTPASFHGLGRRADPHPARRRVRRRTRARCRRSGQEGELLAAWSAARHHHAHRPAQGAHAPRHVEQGRAGVSRVSRGAAGCRSARRRSSSPSRCTSSTPCSPGACTSPEHGACGGRPRGCRRTS